MLETMSGNAETYIQFVRILNMYADKRTNLLPKVMLYTVAASHAASTTSNRKMTFMGNPNKCKVHTPSEYTRTQ